MTHWRSTNVRTSLGGFEHSSARYRADTPRDLKSFYRLPPQSILHGEEIADSPFHVGALCFVVAFGSAIAVLFGVGLCVLRFVGL